MAAYLKASTQDFHITGVTEDSPCQVLRTPHNRIMSKAVSTFVKDLYPVIFVFNAATHTGSSVKTLIADRIMSKAISNLVKNRYLATIVSKAATSTGGFMKTLPNNSIVYKAAIYSGHFDKTLQLPSTVSRPGSFVYGFPDYQGNAKTNKRI